jgi:hypothetical protein
MTTDEQRVIRPAAKLGYLIFAATIMVNPPLWPLGALMALIALTAARENSK